MTVEFSGSRKSNERSRRTRGYRHLFHHIENFPFSFFSTQHLFESLVLLKIFPSVIRGRLLFVEDGETNVCRKKQFLQISFFSFAKSNKSFGAKKWNERKNIRALPNFFLSGASFICVRQMIVARNDGCQRDGERERKCREGRCGVKNANSVSIRVFPSRKFLYSYLEIAIRSGK